MSKFSSSWGQAFSLPPGLTRRTFLLTVRQSLGSVFVTAAWNCPIA